MEKREKIIIGIVVIVFMIMMAGAIYLSLTGFYENSETLRFEDGGKKSNDVVPTETNNGDIYITEPDNEYINDSDNNITNNESG